MRNVRPLPGVLQCQTAEISAGVDIEAPPFLWSGPKAFGTWIADLTASDQKQGVTDGAVELGKPTRVETSGKVACVIVPAVYTFKQKGAPMRESPQMT